LALFTDPRYQLNHYFDHLSIDQQLALQQLKARAYEADHQWLAAVRERVYFAPLLGAEAEHANQQMIWQDLLQLSPQQLQQASTGAANNDLSGWLSLAQLVNRDSHDSHLLAEQVADWRQQWSWHPAAQQPPIGLSQLLHFRGEAPDHIALLLPLSGRLKSAAKAIDAGFNAACQQAVDQQQSPALTITRYDTDGPDSLIELYDQAVAAGAQLVIGPLTRERVEQLAQLNHLPVPLLTLNYGSENTETSLPANFYEFGLSIANQSKALAEQAWQQGYRRAAILYPADAPWAQRALQALQQRWSALGGRLVATTAFPAGGDLNPAITQLLQLDKSKQRAHLLRQRLRLNLTAEPYRRHDIDVIFMLASATEARRIKPALAFYFAGAIPVYATSTIYNGQPDPALDQDVNGVIFTDFPWILNPSLLKTELLAQPDAPVSSLRLYALGIDAYNLARHFNRLIQVTASRIQGATGILSIDQQQVIRYADWAQFRQGQPVVLNDFSPVPE
jgi:outer membrane PBP1 activator LpoA protein